MKNTLRPVLIGCYLCAILGAAAGGLAIVSQHRGAGTALLIASVIISPLALIVQYVTLGYWNPLKLFKKEHVEIPPVEVTRAPWAH